MPKKKGEKPPDPKVWKWCKHPECQKWLSNNVEGWNDPKRNQELVKEPINLTLNAIYLEDYCWRHLPNSKKKQYKRKIEKLVRTGHSFEGANLSYLDLKEAILDKAKLRGACLWGTKLDGSRLEATDFRDAILIYATFRNTKIQETEIMETDFRNANLIRANFEGTQIIGADFRGAALGGVNFKKAYLYDSKFNKAQMEEVELDGAKNLHWEQIEIIAEEERGDWNIAEDSYRNLKNHFHNMGQYEEESKAYYREKLMAKKEARFKKQFLRWLGLSIFHIFTGFGERWLWTVLWALGAIAFFGFLYWGGGAVGWFKFAFKPEMIPSIFQYFYLSVVTFATLGFGDITPLCWQAQVPVVIEVIFGYLFLGLIITIIARRFGR